MVLTTSGEDNQAGYTGFDFSITADWLTSVPALPEAANIEGVTLNSIAVKGANTWTPFTLESGFGLAVYEKVVTDGTTEWSFVGKSAWLTNGKLTEYNSFTFDGLELSATTTYTGVFYAGQAAFNNLNAETTLDSLAGAEYKTAAGDDAGIAVMGIKIDNVSSDSAVVYGSTTGVETHDTAAVIQIDATISSIPEPSAFGLLAGLGALALVASRRRRK